VSGTELTFARGAVRREVRDSNRGFVP